MLGGVEVDVVGHRERHVQGDPVHRVGSLLHRVREPVGGHDLDEPGPQRGAEGRRVASGLRTLVVPGSWAVKKQAEAEGLDQVFKDFGADWRFAGCSMCLGMNPDQLAPGERCASTSNRNFEGRQGKGGRTHLVSPVVAAATAVRGTLSAPSDLESVPAV